MPGLRDLGEAPGLLQRCQRLPKTEFLVNLCDRMLHMAEARMAFCEAHAVGAASSAACGTACSLYCGRRCGAGADSN